MITLKELLFSPTAEKYEIDNLPKQVDVWRNLCDLLSVMNSVRTAYDAPIIVTSGYRSPELNLRVGGVKTSAHQFGLAVDVKLSEKKVESYLAIQKLFSKFAAKAGYNSIVIHEYPKNGIPSWLHLELSKVKPPKVFTIK